MRCRRMVNHVLGGKKCSDVVWFGSYGCDVIAPHQKINIVNPVTTISQTAVGQAFLLKIMPNDNTALITVSITYRGGITRDDFIQPTSPDPVKEWVYQGTFTGLMSIPTQIEISDMSDVEYATLELFPMSNAWFFDDNNKHDNYSDEREAIKDCLNQKLSVIKSELWTDRGYGLPLYEENVKKAQIDMTVLDIVQSVEGVVSVKTLTSEVVNKEYSADIDVATIYGNIQITI